MSANERRFVEVSRFFDMITLLVAIKTVTKINELYLELFKRNSIYSKCLSIVALKFVANSTNKKLDIPDVT